MILTEAFQALLDGKKIRRKDWKLHRYVFLAKEKFIDEYGLDCYFYLSKKNDFTGDIYEIFEENKKDNMNYGQAIDLLIRDYAKKVSMWTNDKIFVFVGSVNGEKHLFVHTARGKYIPWIPQHHEIFEGIWRVIE